LAVGFSVALAPGLRAEDKPSAQPAAQPATASSSAAETQQRLAELEKEVSALVQEINALKQSDAPGMKTAAYHPGGAPASAPAAEPEKVTLAGLLGPTTISGFVDTYYGYNYNHPVDNTSGFRFFDGKTNTFAINMVEMIVDKAPDAMSSEGRFGYHVAAGYGQAANIVNGSDVASDGSNFYIKEAYGSYLAPIGKGLKIDVGKWVTPMGNEVIETNANWNYSRGLLFYYAIPYFHLGARATYVFNSKWTATGGIFNGWNNSHIQNDNFPFTGQSSGLTYHATLAWTPNAKWGVTTLYMAGPVVDNYTNKVVSDWKQLSDTIISFTPNSKWAFVVDGDYGFGPRYYNCEEGCVESPAVKWWGVAGYAKYNFNPKSNFAVRYEYYSDPNGYSGLLFGDNGHAHEVTGTYSYNLTSGLLVRGEYRYDNASLPIFRRGVFGSVNDQHTATLGLVYSFSSANAK